jgi:hypothetical protein
VGLLRDFGIGIACERFEGGYAVAVAAAREHVREA